MKKMKQLITTGLVLVISLNPVSTAFANPLNGNVAVETIKGSIEKDIYYADDFKLVSWIEDDCLIMEQYNKNNVLVERVVGNTKTNVITTTNTLGQTTEYTVTPTETIAPLAVPTPSSYSKIDTVRATNIFEQKTNTMEVYEGITSWYSSQYTVNKYSGTVAKLVVEVLLALQIADDGKTTAKSFYTDILMGFVIDGLLNQLTMTFGANARAYVYYGKDTVTKAQSSKVTTGHNYYITSEDASGTDHYHKTYDSGYIYEDGESFGGMYSYIKNIAQNLYGVDYDVYEM